MTRKAEIEARLAELHAELEALHRELRQIEIDACPIKVGMIVRELGNEYLVREIDKPEWGWVFAVARKKGGGWSSRLRRLYHPEMIDGGCDGEAGCGEGRGEASRSDLVQGGDGSGEAGGAND